MKYLDVERKICSSKILFSGKKLRTGWIWGRVGWKEEEEEAKKLFFVCDETFSSDFCKSLERFLLKKQKKKYFFYQQRSIDNLYKSMNFSNATLCFMLIYVSNTSFSDHWTLPKYNNLVQLRLTIILTGGPSFFCRGQNPKPQLLALGQAPLTSFRIPYPQARTLDLPLLCQSLRSIPLQVKLSLGMLAFFHAQTSHR